MFDLFFQPPLLLWLPNTSFPEMIVKKKNVGAVVVFADEFFFLTKSRMLFVPFGRVSCWLVIRVMLRQSSSHHAWSHLLLPGPATDVMGQHPFADAELKWLQGTPSQAVRWPVRLCVSIFNKKKKKFTVHENDCFRKWCFMDNSMFGMPYQQNKQTVKPLTHRCHVFWCVDFLDCCFELTWRIDNCAFLKPGIFTSGRFVVNKSKYVNSNFHSAATPSNMR